VDNASKWLLKLIWEEVQSNVYNITLYDVKSIRKSIIILNMPLIVIIRLFIMNLTHNNNNNNNNI
jgi:hypothetical protein